MHVLINTRSKFIALYREYYIGFVNLLLNASLVCSIYIENTNESHKLTVIAIKLAVRQFMGYRTLKY